MKSQFDLSIDRRAIHDIQTAIDYYNELDSGLGKDFKTYLDQKFQSLIEHPFYQIRYKDVRCLPLIRFPYMVHFQIDEAHNRIIIRAVLNTFQDTASWL